MNKPEFHIPFIKSLVLVALITIFVMTSSRFLIQYYGNQEINSQKTIEYSSQKSHIQANSLVD